MMNSNLNNPPGGMPPNNPGMMNYNGQPQPQQQPMMNPSDTMNYNQQPQAASSNMIGGYNTNYMSHNQFPGTMPQPGGMMNQQQQPYMQQPGGIMHQNQQPQQPYMQHPQINSSQQPPMMHPPHHQQPPMQPPPPPPQQPTTSTANSHNNNANSNSNNNHVGVGVHRMARPAFVDPATNIMYDTDQAEYEGYLTKQSMWLKDWRRRYFILKGNKLFFAKNEYSAPHGMIDLAHCTTVKSADWKSKKRHSFEISTPEITYLLYADTESEKDDWIGRVGKAIVRCSRTYVGGGQQSQQQQNSNNQYSNPYGVNPDQPPDDDDDDIYTNDDLDNPYFND